jgi:hypothetical protein
MVLVSIALVDINFALIDCSQIKSHIPVGSQLFSKQYFFIVFLIKGTIQRIFNTQLIVSK